jgi:hypothetical protein
MTKIDKELARRVRSFRNNILCVMVTPASYGRMTASDARAVLFQPCWKDLITEIYLWTIVKIKHLV